MGRRTKNKEDIQKLPETFTDPRGVGIPGLVCYLKERTNKKAIYQRSDGVWEVFKIQIRESAFAFGKYYPTAEKYPSTEDFGKVAWCFNDPKLAWKKYRSI